MLSERTIINGLILIAGMILGPYLIILTLEGNLQGLLAFGGIVFLFCVFFLIKDRIALFPLLAGTFAGDLHFIPMGLKPLEVISLVVILYYFVNYVALKRQSFTVGPLYIFIPMLIVAAIVLFHDHKFGLKAMGSTGAEGSRPGLLILVAFLTYLCSINIPTSSVFFMWSIPWWCLFITIVSNAPYILTTYVPSLAPYVYYVSGNVNLDAYAHSINSGTDTGDVGRDGAVIAIGTTLQAVLLAFFAINTWWRPSRWIILGLSLLCLLAILSGGYRNALVTFALITLLGAICYCRWRVLVVLPLMLLAPFALIVIQNEHPAGLTLSPGIQRSMSFIHVGNWDRDVMASAESSNDFRHEIAKVYIAEYLHKSPWIGNGFTFDPDEADGFESLGPKSNDPFYYLIKAFLIRKNFHIGWISVYDAVGIIGSIAFVSLNVAIIVMAGWFVFGHSANMRAPLFPIKVWIFSILATGGFGYVTTFGAFNQTFISLCAFATLLVHLKRIDQRETIQAVSPSPKAPFEAPTRGEAFVPTGTRPRLG